MNCEVKYVAHRCNTVEEVVAAAHAGFYGVEIDVRRAADGELVAHHDSAEHGTLLVELLRACFESEVVALLDIKEAGMLSTLLTDLKTECVEDIVYTFSCPIAEVPYYTRDTNYLAHYSKFTQPAKDGLRAAAGVVVDPYGQVQVMELVAAQKLGGTAPLWILDQSLHKYPRRSKEQYANWSLLLSSDLIVVTKRIDVVLFDLDGVLIKTDGLHDETFLEAAREAGIPVGQPEWPEAITSIQKLELLGVSDKIRQQEIKERKNALYAQRLPEFAKFHTQLAAKLKTYKDAWGVRIGVCTNSTGVGAAAMIKLLGIQDVVDLVLCQEDVVHPKPNPEMYSLAIQRLGGTPSSTIIYEDSEPGFEAAVASGALAFKTTYEEMLRRIDQCAF